MSALTSLNVAQILGWIVTNICLVAVITVAIGATAPRWPARWLLSDVGPLRLTPFDDVDKYKSWGLINLARRLPEAGAAFGGKSKRQLPERTAEAVSAYLVELRRGEWVHWLSLLSILPLPLVSPWWLAFAFAVVVCVVNFTFIAILRLNRLRYLAITERLLERD